MATQTSCAVETEGAFVCCPAFRRTANDLAEGESCGRCVQCASRSRFDGRYRSRARADGLETRDIPGSVVPRTASRALGEPCSDAAECASAFCVDGVCCESACEAGFSCVEPGFAGTCSLAGLAGDEFQVNEYTPQSQTHPAVAMERSGSFIVAWQSSGSTGIFARRYDSGGNALGAILQVNTYTGFPPSFPDVAVDDTGNFVVAWETRYRDGDKAGIFGRRFGSAGVPLGTEFQINTYTSNSQSFPAVAMDAAGNFVTVWSSVGEDGDGQSVRARRYESGGSPLGSAFQVNSFTADYQSFPAVGMDEVGSFVVAWQSYGQDGHEEGVFGQRYDSSGVPRGTEFQVNTYTSSKQFQPAVAMGGDGSFVIAWESSDQDGFGNGIFAQRYDSSGNVLGTEFQVNAYTLSIDFGPAVSMNSAGSFVITWESPGQDGSFSGIFGQRYDAGEALGGEFQVNTYTLREQYTPDVAVDDAGNFVVAWASNLQDGSQWGIFARRFARASEITGRILYYDGEAPVAGVTVSLSGDDSQSTTTNAAGEFSFSDIPPDSFVSIHPHKLGEQNNAISSLDAARILQVQVGLISFDSLQALACDVTGNGAISSLDAARILQLKVGLIDILPAALACFSDWLFVPIPGAVANQSVFDPLLDGSGCLGGEIAYEPLTGAARGQDFLAILLGDCTGNWAPLAP